MREKAVTVRQAREIRASPERVWSLLASPAVWSLRPGRFAFDVAAAGEELRLRVVLAIGRSGGLAYDVFEVAEEAQGMSLSLSRVSARRNGELAFCLSAVPGRRGPRRW